MSDAIIRIEKLGKRYRYGAKPHISNSFADDLKDWTRGLLRLNRGRALESDGRAASFKAIHERRIAESPDYFWALKDINLEIKQGEVVGIIGRNGAGKSTLLKILSRITPPTVGKITYHGRMASLLEVGTGFHRELTGRENIFLNGSILGMKRAEIARKFDEIVAFAEVEKFIDTPVKFYSSGMYVRLAFAVAAHLEPDILVVDEVLAVGDASFQRKCLGKMGEVAHAGRTILFVSHSMSAVQRLCSTAVLVEKGQISHHGKTPEVVEKYLSQITISSQARTNIDVSQRADRRGSKAAYFTGVTYTGLDSKAGYQPCVSKPLEFDITIFSDATRLAGSISVAIYDLHGVKLLNADSKSLGMTFSLRDGLNTFKLRFNELLLNSGTYMIGLWLANPTGEILDWIESAFEFNVVEIETAGFGVKDAGDGLIPCHFTWQHFEGSGERTEHSR